MEWIAIGIHELVEFQQASHVSGASEALAGGCQQGVMQMGEPDV
jgi:hypothetical protein